jgi:molybdate transport system permease protein
VDWPHFWSLITSESSTTALVLSLKTAAASIALCLLLGVPMALVLARSDARLVRTARPLILLPLLAPGLISGAALAFARSLGEFGATLTFAVSRDGVTRTLPLEI